MSPPSAHERLPVFALLKFRLLVTLRPTHVLAMHVLSDEHLFPHAPQLFESVASVAQ
jgi:hypothetical protein